MGFQQGLSGLNASAKNLDVIGNNVANANTVGFKQSQAQFADVYASTLVGNAQIGTGVKVAAVAQQFGQGNLSVTNNSMDVAISGNGFYRMDNNGVISYTRNGQFQLDKNGFMVNNQGLKLTGYPVNAAGTIVTGAPGPIQISAASLQPQATVNVTAGLNLDSRAAVPLTAVFNPLDPTSYNNSTSATVYDSLGGSHVATMYFQKTAANAWNSYLAVDGVLVPAVATPLAAMTFSTSGALLTPAGGVATSAAFTPAGGGAAQTLNINFATTSQFGSTFGVNSLTQDGYATGQLSGFSTGADGIIIGRYSNGQTKPMGQVVLANFSNAQGLVPMGNNQWAESVTSGIPLVGSPGSSSLGVLQSGSVEDSNVDLTAELVNMITAQRSYQANAQTIKTQDQLMQTLVNLR
ncbi:MAG: flagellar hook protein FlgE [Gallionella sp.]|nr:flagellar hook protein FlgE [Gallionella sp.]